MRANKVLSSAFWVYIENTSTQVISFIVTIVLARLLEPEHYGAIAILTVFITLAQVFVTTGISSALIQKKGADELDYSSMFWFNLILSVVLYSLLFLLAPIIGKYYNDDQLVSVLRVFALSIPLSAFNCIQQAYVSSRMVFRKSFVSSFWAGLLSGGIGILMAYWGFGLWSLVAQRNLFVAFSTIILFFILDWRPSFIFSYGRLRPLLSFGWKMMTTTFLLTAYNQFRSLIIGKRYSASELGYYDRGFSFPNLIASNIDSTITRVLFPALAQEQGELLSLVDKTRRAAKISSFIMTPVLWGLAIIAYPLVELLLGEKWLPCVPYLQIMCFVWWLQPTQTCSAQAIKAIGRSDIYLYIEILSKIIGIVLLIIAILVYDSVFSIAIMFFVGQVLAVFIYGFFTQKHIGYKVIHQIDDIGKPALMSAIMCFILFFIGVLVQNPLVCILCQVVTGGLIYVGIAILTKNETFRYLFSLVSSQR